MNLIKIILCSALLFVATMAQAVPVTVNTGAYQGRWAVDSTAWINGIATIDLSVGVHQMMVGYYGRFNIDVAADGTVTTAKTDSATAVGNTLTFKTTTINVDPGVYTGRWIMDSYWVSGWIIGAASQIVVPGLTYQMIVGYYGRFNIDVAADGTVTTAKTDSATAVGNTLTFKTTTINVDPGAYTGRWSMDSYWVSGWIIGAASQIVVPGLTYQMIVGYYGRFNIDVAADGTVTTAKTDSATAVGNTLTFKTTTINVDPGGSQSPWLLEAYNVNNIGSTNFEIVPGLRYQIRSYQPNQIAGYIDILAPCAFTAPSLVVGTNTFTFTCVIAAPPNQVPVADAGVGQNVYLGQMVYLNGAASSDSDGDVIVSYTWTFDSVPSGSFFAAVGTTLTGVAPNFTPDLVGDYMLSLVVNDGALNSAAATVLVTASQNLAPIATATAPVTTGDVPLTVSFDASASYDPEGGIVSYSWNFADPATGVNNISILPNPVHTFNTAGTYTVLVDVIDDFGNVTQASVSIIATDPVVVTPPPVDPGMVNSNELELLVYEAKVDYGKEGKVKGKVSVKVGFINAGMPTAGDRVSVSLDGVVLLDVPFSEFKAKDDKQGEFEYKGKKLKAKIDFTKSTIKIKCHKMVLSDIDNSDGVDIEVSIGSLGGFENVEMKAKHDNNKDEFKLSYKNKQHDD